MEWYKLISLGTLAICLGSCIFHFIRLIQLGKPIDYSVQAGDTTKAVIYSLTGAMSPAKKESAYLHLPTYTAGILYHLGTFLAILLFFTIIAGASYSGILKLIIVLFLSVTTISGLIILIKRLVSPALKSLSNPDDYISNALVTLFQAFTVLVLTYPSFEWAYYVAVSLLLLYLPLGKLKHAIYFFAARYHLGYFLGYRGTWPPVKQNTRFSYDQRE
ncbi:MAG: hypothetical protein FJY11_03460 [Bacteroidetes bacterium]|nr:hypothetical protein [Bacteroidota bacterium]